MICLVKGTYFTNFLTPWSRFLIHKLIVAHLVKKFPNLYGTWRFITTFTVARYWTLFWARWIQSTSSHPLLYESLSNVGSSLHVFRLKFCTYFSSPRACYMSRQFRPPWFDRPNNIWWSVLVMKLLMRFSPASRHFIPLRSKHSAQHPQKFAAEVTGIG